MFNRPDDDPVNEKIYIAGDVVPPGKYRLVGSDRVLVIEKEDVLPASFDGKVACYMLEENTWENLKLNSQVQTGKALIMQ